MEIEEDSDGVWSIVGGKVKTIIGNYLLNPCIIVYTSNSISNSCNLSSFVKKYKKQASCRRIFSLDVVLLDAFGGPVNKEFEVVASLLYADNGVPVENTNDAEPPVFVNCDGIEYASHDRPCKLINGRASFKLKISQVCFELASFPLFQCSVRCL